MQCKGRFAIETSKRFIVKKFFISYLFIFMFLGAGISEAQGFVDLSAGRTQRVYGFDASYQTFKRKTKKGEDYYRITVTVTNEGNNWIHVFPVAARRFRKNNKTFLADFRFVNATGRGFSATEGRLYPHPVYIKVPIDIKKNPPPKDPKADQYNHYMKTYVAGIQVLNGQTMTRSFNVRVRQGAIPRVQVMIQ